MSELVRDLAAVGAVAALAAGWLAVQMAWRRAFPDAHPDPDPLAGRLGCHGCGECKEQCGPERPRRAPVAGEERS